MTIRPSNTMQRLLISTTSRFVGEYERSAVLVNHAWPNPSDGSRSFKWAEGPNSRSAFVFAFETSPLEPKAGQLVPDYGLSGEVLCSYLAVLFGKRFDSHGAFQQNGLFHIPDLGPFNRLCEPRFPQNSHSPRKDYTVPLNLTEIARIERLLLSGQAPEPDVVSTFQGAAKFYLQALQTIEVDPEVAYLHLITSGEILSNFQTYDPHACSL